MSLLAALAAVAALSAPADDLSDLKPQDKADLQCMAVAIVSIGISQDEALQFTLAKGATFFYGRLQGRSPDIDWMARYAAYMRASSGPELDVHRERCAGEIQTMLASFSRGA